MEEVIDNPIIIDKDFDYIGTGKKIRGKNPNEPIFSVVGHSLKVSITAVIVDNDQTLVEYSDIGSGVLWILGCQAKKLVTGFAPESSIVVVGSQVSCDFLDDVTALNKLTRANLGNTREYNDAVVNPILHNEPTPGEVLTFQLKKNLTNGIGCVIVKNENITYVGGFTGDPITLDLNNNPTVWECCSLNNSNNLPSKSIFINSYLSSYYDEDNFVHINPRSTFDLKEPIRFADRKKGSE